MVIRIEALGEQHLHDLTTPIKMIFRNISDNKEDVSVYVYVNLVNIYK